MVVGGGASGLAAAATLERRGFEPVVLERDDRIGGTWARRYERLHLHTVRAFSGLPGHAIPRELGRYVHKDGYAGYLEQYATRLALDVRLGEEVRRIRPGWTVETDGERWEARAVVVATGKYARRRIPAWPGASGFGGPLVHSSDYVSGRDYKGKRVLVVGAGNSGSEIAADLVEQGAARVAIAIRTSPPITTREVLGVPVQVWGIALSPFPAALVEPVATRMRRFSTRDLRQHGIAEEGWSPLRAKKPPVIDVGFLRELRAGRIEVKPAVAELEPGGVRFADGSADEFDAVIAATGFTTGLAELLDVDGILEGDGLPREPQPREHPGLWFMGYGETVRGQLFEANRQARRLARDVERYLR